MNCPECDDLKKTYDGCFQEFVINRAKNWDYKQMSEDSINKCDDVFQVNIAVALVEQCVNIIRMDNFNNIIKHTVLSFKIEL